MADKKTVRVAQSFSGATTPEQEWELFREFAEEMLGKKLTEQDKVKFMAKLQEEETKDKK